MFAAVYTSGHLVTAAFSAAMAIAFAISAVRVPNSRADWWYVATFVLTGSGGIAEMLLVTAPSLAVARSYLALLGVLIMFIALAFHAQYAAGVFTPRARRRHRVAVAAFACLTAVVVAVIYAGLGDEHQVRVILLAGVRSSTLALSPSGFAFLLSYVCISFAVEAPVLLRRGERQSERRLVAVPVLLTPLVGAYELLICLGVNPFLPIGGYFTAAAGLVGAFILAERIRGVIRQTSIIGNYHLEERIGGGGMADVYAARRIANGGSRLVQRVALKRLRPELAENSDFVEMFFDEARTVARLHHPNIVALYDVGKADGNVYLAMELVDGPSLAKILRCLYQERATLDAATTVEIALQVADALGYAHTLADEEGEPLQLVHRDVSPQNLLVTTNGHVKLADFGIARSSDRNVQTATGVLKGKLSYMAPEQLRGEAYDHRVDLYALGIVMFEALAGERPFRSHSDPALLAEILAIRKPDLSRLIGAPPALVDLVGRLIAPRASERPASADAVRAILEAMRNEPLARGRLMQLARASSSPSSTDAETASTVVASPRQDVRDE